MFSRKQVQLGTLKIQIMKISLSFGLWPIDYGKDDSHNRIKLKTKVFVFVGNMPRSQKENLQGGRKLHVTRTWGTR